ncbi:hypothetical protein PIB30_075636, partial [Stylosanthes scabra]|nr:hypothetical protein [Stylosanthes scabra]
MRVVVVVPPSGGRNFHTGAPIDAPFEATRSSRLPLRFHPNNYCHRKRLRGAKRGVPRAWGRDWPCFYEP